MNVNCDQRIRLSFDKNKDKKIILWDFQYFNREIENWKK